MRRFFCLLVGTLAGLLAAQESPTPEFDLVGQVTQKFRFGAPAWEDVATSQWDFWTTLRPRFTYGPVSFRADATVALPLTASLVPDEVSVAVAEAYFRVAVTDSLDVTFGQKRFPLGVGQTVTVGDTLNPVMGLFDQKTGFRGLAAEWSPVSWASLSGAVAENGRLDEWSQAGQASVLWGPFQLTGSAVVREGLLTPAAGLSVDLFGVIVTAEGAILELSADTEARPSGSAGARWAGTWGDWELTLAGELLHAEPGWATHGQNNAFFRVLLGAGGEFSWSGFVAVDLDDASVMGQTAVVWNPWENLDVGVQFQASSGEANSSWEYFTPTRERYLAGFSMTYHF